MSIRSAGKRNHKVLIRRRMDIPIGYSDVDSEYTDSFYKWAKVTQPKSSTYSDSVQIGDVITHYFEVFISTGKAISMDYEIVWLGMIYKIKRCRWLDSFNRNLLLECEEAGKDE